MDRSIFRGGYGRGHRQSSSTNRLSARNNLSLNRPNSRNGSLLNIESRSFSVSQNDFSKLSDMLRKEPNELIIKISQDNFQLKKYLSDNRLKHNFQWLEILTNIFERILNCLGQDKRIAQILIQLPGSIYLDVLYEEIRQKDLSTGQLRFNLILQTLKIIDRLLTYSPHAEGDVTPLLERIGTQIIQSNIENEAIKVLHSMVMEKAQHLYHEKQMKIQSVEKQIIETRPPPNNFRLLNIIPSMNDILSYESIYLRRNIVDQGGSYEDSNHYLDIHFRLLREDFLGPLRDGIQAYVSGLTSKNVDVRIYKNVYSLGPKINSRCGLVYGLQLDKKKFSKIQWQNSRRLIYGSLLALTSNQFASCILVTVEDRSNIENTLTFYVRPYIETSDLLVNPDLTKFDLLIHQQYLTMIETTSYFESYRHILRALQKISPQEFPLPSYILHLSHDVTPPDYVTSTSQFDFTPLIVSKERENKFERVTLLNNNQWPTPDELDLNEKQHAALKLALTKKVALIQGPPGM